MKRLTNDQKFSSVSSVADVREQHPKERTFRESENTYRVLAEESPNMIFINQRGRVIYANRRCTEIMGYTLEEFYGPAFDVARLMAGESVTAFRKNYARKLRCENLPPQEYSLVTKYGEHLQALISTRRILFDGAPAILGIVTDITEKKWIEREKTRYMQNLSFLSRSAMDFVKLPPDGNLFSYVGDHLRALSGNALIFLNEFDPASNTITICSAHGPEGLLGNLTQLFGRALIGMNFALARNTVHLLTRGKLVKTTGDANDHIAAQLPRTVIRELEKLLNTNALYLMPFTVHQEILGSAAIIPLNTDDLPNANLIEAFINQAAITLKRMKDVGMIRRKEQEFRALVENSPDLIFRLDRHFQVVYANPAARQATGVSSRRPSGKASARTGLPQEIVSRWQHVLKHVFVTGKKEHIEFGFDSTKGLRYYHMLAIPEFSPKDTTESLLIIAHDVTEAKTLEDTLSMASTEWRLTFDGINDLVAIHDRSHTVTRVNRAFSQAFNMPPDKVIGTKCYALWKNRITPCPDCQHSRVIETGTMITREFKDPRTGCWSELTISPVRDSRGQIIKTIHIVKNITDRKNAEEVMKRDRETLEALVREKTEALLGAQKKLEESQRLSDIGVFAATIAHEIRNPLAAIRTAAYNVRRKSRDTLLESHLANIEKKVDESDQIIKNLLSFSRIKLPNYEKADLFAILGECIASAAEKYSHWDVVVSKELDPADRPAVDADPVHLMVLFSNVLDNAYQALPGKKGHIDIKAFFPAPDRVSVTMRDNGTGIEREDLPRITNPFFTRKSRGIGLGLAVCNQIVSMHGGTITFDSAKGKGTTVTILLPTVHTSPEK